MASSTPASRTMPGPSSSQTRSQHTASANLSPITQRAAPPSSPGAEWFSEGTKQTTTQANKASSQSNGTSAVSNLASSTQGHTLSTAANLMTYPDTNQTSSGANWMTNATNWTTNATNWTPTVENWTSSVVNWTSPVTDSNLTNKNSTPEAEWLSTVTNQTLTELYGSSIENATNITWFTSTEVNRLSTDTNWNSTAANWTMAEAVESHSVPVAILYLYFSLRILWALLTVIGNTMTIFIVARFEVFHTSSNYLICSLAVADLISVPVIPLTIIHHTYPDGDYFIPICLIEQTISILSTAGSLVNIMYISIDRYIYIAFPMRYQSLITSSRTLTLIFLTWAAYMVSTPLTMYFASRLTVGMTCKFSIFLLPAVYRSYMTPQFLIFLFLTIGFNAAIAKIAYKQTRAIAAAQQSYNTVEASVSRRTRKISGMLGTLLGVYLLCTIPQYVMALIIHRRVTTVLLSVEHLTSLIYWGATWVNPIVYVWRLKQFRAAFRKVLTGQGNLHDFTQ